MPTCSSPELKFVEGYVFQHISIIPRRHSRATLGRPGMHHTYRVTRFSAFVNRFFLLVLPDLVTKSLDLVTVTIPSRAVGESTRRRIGSGATSQKPCL